MRIFMSDDVTKMDASYSIDNFMAMAEKVIGETKKSIIGKDELIDDLFIVLLAGGSILLEGIPGVAKTTIARTFATAVGLDFKRVQFVPDIMPSDILGSNIYHQSDSRFEFHKGPVFTNILLVDEINRASPKLQSSLLEAMEEKQATVEGITYDLPDPFMLIATQNPKEVTGVFPLPESQVDRFMFRLDVNYPTWDEELEIIRVKNGKLLTRANRMLVADEVLKMIAFVDNVYVDEKVMMYIRNLVIASRSHEHVLIGGSPRASISLLRASKSYAALHGRDYVIPQDIKDLAPKVLNHRLVLKPEYDLEGLTPWDVIIDLLNKVEVPA
jgi:MoxR-like ATPase